MSISVIINVIKSHAEDYSIFDMPMVCLRTLFLPTLGFPYNLQGERTKIKAPWEVDRQDRSN